MGEFSEFDSVAYKSCHFVWLGQPRSHNVTNFGTDPKPKRDFLLANNTISYLAPLL